MSDKETFYLTTPIFYPNAKLHMGHAYTTTLSDILVRYQRLQGNDTYFLTGSDENTQKMVQAAEKVEQTPAVFLNGIIENFKSLFVTLNISYDQFIRTSDEVAHWPGAVALWQKLVEAGDIEKRQYEGLYCVGHEAFVTEKDLVDGLCPDHGTAPERIQEENYFFLLSRYTNNIREKILNDELRIVPSSRRNEILSLLDQGLEDISFSRPRTATSVGIPVPGDDTQVMYVWCDALSNYVTALGYGQDETRYKKFWPANVHVIGKDILRFHAAIWPGMLLSAGIPLPKSLLVHGFITSGGKKMSKTLGNIIDPEELLAEYGTDAVRYYLARHITPFEDGDLTRDAFKELYNANLANGLGNFAARVLTLSEKYLSEPVQLPVSKAPFPVEYTQALESYEINIAADYVWRRIGVMDQEISRTEPFKVIKIDPVSGRELITNLVLELYRVAELLEPFIPETSGKIIEAIMSNKKPDTLFPRKD